MIISSARAMEAAELLDVPLEGLRASKVKDAFRAKAKDCHPDHHGTEKLQQWARISWAKEALLHWVAKHPPSAPEEESLVSSRGDCRACDGTGRVKVVQRGFGKPLTMSCVICRGMGTVLVEENDSD